MLHRPTFPQRVCGTEGEATDSEARLKVLEGGRPNTQLLQGKRCSQVKSIDVVREHVGREAKASVVEGCVGPCIWIGPPEGGLAHLCWSENDVDTVTLPPLAVETGAITKPPHIAALGEPSTEGDLAWHAPAECRPELVSNGVVVVGGRGT